MHTRLSSSTAVRVLVGSTIARLPCAHFGSIELSQGLLLGSQQGTICTPASPFRREANASWLCWRSQSRTARLTCQGALSHTITNTLLPSSANRTHNHSRYRI